MELKKIIQQYDTTNMAHTHYTINISKMMRLLAELRDKELDELDAYADKRGAVYLKTLLRVQRAKNRNDGKQN